MSAGSSKIINKHLTKINTGKIGHGWSIVIYNTDRTINPSTTWKCVFTTHIRQTVYCSSFCM